MVARLRGYSVASELVRFFARLASEMTSLSISRGGMISATGTCRGTEPIWTAYSFDNAIESRREPKRRCRAHDRSRSTGVQRQRGDCGSSLTGVRGDITKVVQTREGEGAYRLVAFEMRGRGSLPTSARTLLVAGPRVVLSGWPKHEPLARPLLQHSS